MIAKTGNEREVCELSSDVIPGSSDELSQVICGSYRSLREHTNSDQCKITSENSNQFKPLSFNSE